MIVELGYDVYTGRITIDCPRRLSHQLSRIPGASCKADVWSVPYSAQHFYMVHGLIPSAKLSDQLSDLLEVDLTELIAVHSHTANWPEPANGSYSHQVAMENWIEAITDANLPGGLITAGVGTGKTRTMIRAIQKDMDNTHYGPYLIICPAGLKRNWESEFALWAPEIKVSVVGGTAAQRRKQITADADVIIINYESLAAHSKVSGYGSVKLSDKDREPGLLNKNYWRFVVLDEGHRIGNPQTKQARACWAIGSTSDHRFVMTATPISNNVGDVWSLLRFINPDLFPGRSKYLDLFADIVDNPFGYQDIKGFKSENYALFKKIVGPIHFHVQPDVALDLPDVIRKTTYVQMSPKLRKQYNAVEKKKMLQIADFPDIPLTEAIVRQTRLQQIAQGSVLDMNDLGEIYMTKKNGKVGALIELLGDIPPDEKVVIFSQSKDLLMLAGQAIMESHDPDDERIGSVITGDVSQEDRATLVKDFQENPLHTYMLATMATMSEGHTLTAARHCIFIQRSYSLVQNEQAEGRLRRIGQEADTIHIHDIVMEGTVDEDPVKAITEKGDRLAEMLATGKQD